MEIWRLCLFHGKSGCEFVIKIVKLCIDCGTVMHFLVSQMPFYLFKPTSSHCFVRHFHVTVTYIETRTTTRYTKIKHYTSEIRLIRSSYTYKTAPFTYKNKCNIHPRVVAKRCTTNFIHIYTHCRALNYSI